MDKVTKISQPRYQQIALEIAKRIVEGRYQSGEKLHARSTIATNFHVSPETARKAISILSDIDVVEVKHGSGFFVGSKEKARQFVTQYQDVQSLASIKQQINASVKRQQTEIKTFTELLNDLVEQTQRYNEDNQLIPYEVTVGAGFVASNVQALNFWHKTGATIVAIRHHRQLQVSPGPLAEVHAGDVVFFVGDELAQQRVGKLLAPK